jgi:hypothetical protein
MKKDQAWPRETRLLTAIVALGIGLNMIASRADAAPLVTWTLQDVIFASGQTANGGFTLDQVAETLVDWNIQLTGGTNPTLTNLSFLPGGSCVVSCGRFLVAGAPISASSTLDLRTTLAPDNTFFEFVLFLDAERNELIHPTVTEIHVNTESAIDFALLLNPGTVHQDLGMDKISATAINPRIVTTPEPSVVPEPATLFLLGTTAAGLGLARWRQRRRKQQP